jgi:serine/threonine-protein kinase
LSLESIAHYKVSAKIGEGGMGEVYRATDSKLGRDVALKVLPESVANDFEYLARFGREAEVLASLNHPNIAIIHGFEHEGGTRALVMELVEGDTLQDRMQRGPIELPDVLKVGRQVADALEEAHDNGIVHRDLKPANIKITPEGRVKVLDFGLAKAMDGQSAVGSDPSHSPTLSLAATQAGVILGTAAYMSPEQASGQAVDKRADIWAFGVVLYEMLCRRALFKGETAAHIMADVLRADVDWDQLPSDLPTPLVKLLRRCLDRDPKRRLRDVGEARLVLEDLIAGRAEPEPAAVEPEAPRRFARLPWAVAGVAVVAMAVVLALGGGSSAERSSAPSKQLDVAVSEELFFTGIGSSVVLSPDGTQLAFCVGDANRNDLYIRSLDRDGAVMLAGGDAGSQGAYNPFFSPDGQWLGFVTSSELRKVQVTGGTPLKLADVARTRGADWLEDGRIIFTESPASALSVVSAAGGQVTALTELGEDEDTHRWPHALPGGEAVLFTSHNSAAGFDDANLEVLFLETGERKVVYRGGTYGRYLPSGHLLFVNRENLFAVPFDLDEMEVRGTPIPVLQNLSASTEGGAQFSFSQTGDLVYLPGGVEVPQYPIIWVNRDNSVGQLWPEPGAYANPRLSPDGTRLSLTVFREQNWDIWVYDLDRGVSTRLTFDEGVDSEQVWTPDGEYLIFSSDRDGADSLYRKRADGSGDVERLTEASVAQWTSQVSPDGRYVIFGQADTLQDIWYLELDGESEPQRFLGTEFGEGFGAVSPDGRWIAYGSNESGAYQIYVRPFPTGEGKWQVSDQGGAFPRWTKGGREIVWRDDEGMMAAEIEDGGGAFRSLRPRRVLSGGFQGGVLGVAVGGFQFSDFDASVDGERFVLFPDPRKQGRGAHDHVTLVTDWMSRVERAFAVAD